MLAKKKTRSYELYLTKPINGKDIITIETDDKIIDLNSWLIRQVNKGSLTKEIASSILFVA